MQPPRATVAAIFASITRGRSRGPAEPVLQPTRSATFRTVSPRRRSRAPWRESASGNRTVDRSAPSGPKWWTSAPYAASSYTTTSRPSPSRTAVSSSATPSGSRRRRWPATGTRSGAASAAPITVANPRPMDWNDWVKQNAPGRRDRQVARGVSHEVARVDGQLAVDREQGVEPGAQGARVDGLLGGEVRVRQLRPASFGAQCVRRSPGGGSRPARPPPPADRSRPSRSVPTSPSTPRSTGCRAPMAGWSSSTCASRVRGPSSRPCRVVHMVRLQPQATRTSASRISSAASGVAKPPQIPRSYASSAKCRRPRRRT